MRSSIAKFLCLIDAETEASEVSLLVVYTQSCTGQQEPDEELATIFFLFFIFFLLYLSSFQTSMNQIGLESHHQNPSYSFNT